MSTDWKPPIPPHHLHRDLLAPDEHRALLAWAASTEDLLTPSRTFRGIEPDRRQSMSLKLTSAENIDNPAIAPWRELLSRRLYLSLGFVPYGLERDAIFADGRFFDDELLALDLRDGSHRGN